MGGGYECQLKDIFGALIAWIMDIIQNSNANNNDAFGVLNIAKTIQDSFADAFEELMKEVGDMLVDAAKAGKEFVMNILNFITSCLEIRIIA